MLIFTTNLIVWQKLNGGDKVKVSVHFPFLLTACIITFRVLFVKRKRFLINCQLPIF